MKKLYSFLMIASLCLISPAAFSLSLVRTVPADAAIDISLSNKIVLIFSENVYLGSGHCLLNGEELTPAISGKYVSFSPSLDYLVTYTYTAEAGAFVNAAGEKSEAFSISFTTTGPTPKLFDAIVAKDSTGDYASVQEAIDNAPANRTAPWLIFIKKGTYNELLRIPSTKPYMHLIGEDLENTIIQYKINCASSSSDNGWDYSANKMGLPDGSVVVISAPNFYTENISYINTWGYEVKNGPQALVFKSYHDKFIANNCKMLSYQDTWQTTGRSNDDRHYAKNCLIEGAVDFIYGGGNCYLDSCTLSIARTSGAVIVAPAHGIGTKWGYIFMNCTIDAPKTSSTVYFGRPWHNAPKASFVNTRLTQKVSIAPAGWIEHMGTIPAIFADYNTINYLGNPVDLSQRIDTYWYTDGNGKRVEGKAQKTLSDAEVAKYTLKNVLSGSDNWRPDFMTTAPSAPVIGYADNKIVWGKIGLATCYIISRDGNAIGFTTGLSYDVEDASASYTVRACGEYGALSGYSNALVPAGVKEISAAFQPKVFVQQGQIHVQDIDGQTNIRLYSLSGLLLSQMETDTDTAIAIPGQGRFIIQLISNKYHCQYLL